MCSDDRRVHQPEPVKILDAVVAGLLTLIPGLDTTLVLRSSLTRTRSYAWTTALGGATGAMAWGIAEAAGISALLTISELAYRVLTMAGAGAGYMLWFGTSMIWKSFWGDAGHGTADTAVPVVAASAWQGWLIGAGTNLLNPKVGGLLHRHVPANRPCRDLPVADGRCAGRGALRAVADLLRVFDPRQGYARRWLAGPKALAVIDQVTGLVLVAFGIKLLTDSLPASSAAFPRRRG